MRVWIGVFAVAAVLMSGCSGDRAAGPVQVAATSAEVPWAGVSTVGAAATIADTVAARLGRRPSLECVEAVVAGADEDVVRWMLWAGVAGGEALVRSAPLGSDGVMAQVLNC